MHSGSRFSLFHRFQCVYSIDSSVSQPVPEVIDLVFTKTSPKRSFSVIQNERFELVFTKTGSINSGTGAIGLFSGSFIR